MKVEPLKLKMLGDGMRPEPVSGTRVFIPTGRREETEQPEAPPPPVFSEEDMKVAEREGFQKGFHEGVKEGRSQAENEQAEINRKLTEQVEVFAMAVAPLFTHYCEMAMTVKREVPKIALAIARKVAGEALDKGGHEIIGDLAARCCETMISEPELTITVHESLGNTLEVKLQELATRLPEATHIIIVRDPGMPVTDCRIEWRHGSMEHSVQELWGKVEKVVANLTETTARDTAAELAALTATLSPPASAPEVKPTPERSTQQNTTITEKKE